MQAGRESGWEGIKEGIKEGRNTGCWGEKIGEGPSLFSRLNHERQMSEIINYRPTPNPSSLINE